MNDSDYDSQNGEIASRKNQCPDQSSQEQIIEKFYSKPILLSLGFGYSLFSILIVGNVGFFYSIPLLLSALVLYYNYEKMKRFIPYFYFILAYLFFTALIKWRSSRVIYSFAYKADSFLFETLLGVRIPSMQYPHLNKSLLILLYVIYSSLPLIFVFSNLYWMRKKQIDAFSLGHSILILSLIIFIIHLIFPMAPPWYILEIRDEIHFSNISDRPESSIETSQGLLLIIKSGIQQFTAYKFGSTPSAHIALATYLVLMLKHRPKFESIIFACYFLLQVFAVILLGYHWTIDALSGILTSIISWKIATPMKDTVGDAY